MKKLGMYDILGLLAMIATPLAASIFFGWKSYQGVHSLTDGVLWLAIPAGIGAAIGLESVGIFAGHVATDFYKAEDPRWKLAALLLVAYVAIGVIELWGTTGVAIFLISPMVYLLVGLRYDANQVAIEQAKERHQDMAHKRDLDKKKLDLRHAENMAKIQAPARTAVSSPARTRPEDRQLAGNLPDDWRQLTDVQRHNLAHSSPEERAILLAGKPERTRRKWNERLEDIPAQNGQYLPTK